MRASAFTMALRTATRARSALDPRLRARPPRPVADASWARSASRSVTRAVYRHFPDEATLFDACSADWLSRQRPPDPSRWSDIADARERLRTGLADVYRFYTLPPARQEFLRHRDAQLADRLAGSMPGTAAQRRRRRAVVGHAASFWTWWSLCHRFGLSDREAIESLLTAILGGRLPAPS